MNIVEFLKPSLIKIGVVLVIPLVVGLLVTQRIENTIDFYGYLLTPMMPFYNGNSITYIFNKYFLLWIPFYLIACAMVMLFIQIRTNVCGYLYSELDAN